MSDLQQTTNIHTINAGAVATAPGGVANGIFYAPGERPSSAQLRLDDCSKLLIIVVGEVERMAVMRAAASVNGSSFTRRFVPHHTVYELGRIGRTDVSLAQMVGQGTVRPDSAGVAVPALIDAVRPDFILLVGICYGLREDEPRRPQRIGDVLIATDLLLVAHRKIAEMELDRGGFVHPSPTLVDRLRTAGVDWDRQASIHMGPMVSESVLVNSRLYRDRIKAAYSEAVGGEMEGAGVYAAAMRSKVDWGVVKAISDWGYDKRDQDQLLAADNAAALVIHMVAIGGLDPLE